YELKIGQSIRTEECPLLGALHEKKKDTPTMGGILILFAMMAAMLLWMDLKHVFTLILLITTLYFGCLGGRDDYLKLKYRNVKGLAGRKKIIFQVILGGLLACYLLSPEIAKSVQIGSWFAPPLVKDRQELLSLQEYATRFYLPFFKDPLFIFSGIFTLLAAL